MFLNLDYHLIVLTIEQTFHNCAILDGNQWNVAYDLFLKTYVLKIMIYKPG